MCRIHTRRFFTSFLTSLALLLLTHRATAQFTGYSFSQNTSGTYTALSGGTVAASGAGLNDQRYLVTLPFPFTVAGVTHTQAYLCINGYIALGTVDPGTASSGIASSARGFSVAAGFSADLASLTSPGITSELRYETIGTAPNRTFVVQWKDFGYLGTTILRVNFQIQLSEGSNTMKVVYGSCSHGGTTSMLSVQVGLRDTTNSSFFHRSGTNTILSVWPYTTGATSNTDNILYTSNDNPANGLTYIFSAPPVCVAPTSQASNLVLTANSRSSVSGSFSGASATGYLVVRTPGTAAWNQTPVNGTSYTTGTTVGNGTVVAFGSSTSFTNSSLTQSTQYTYTVYAYNWGSCMGGLKYNTSSPATGSVATLGPKAYTWAGGTSGAANWMTSTNWSPTRTITDVEDTLIFNSGSTHIVTNVPTQSMDGLRIQNNTSVLLQSNNVGDSLMFQRFLTLEAGSTLTLTGAPKMKLRFIGTNPRTATLAGTLNLQGSSLYDANGSTTTISGVVNVSGAGAILYTSCTTCTNAIVFAAGAVYNHERDGGALPKAQYAPTSTVNITGTIANSPLDSNIYGAGVTLGNLNFNTPGLTASIDQGYFYKVGGNLSIMSSGTSTGKIAVKYMDVRGNFYGKGNKVEVWEGTYWGTVTLDTGVFQLISPYTSAIVFKGDFTQTSAATTTYSCTLNFKGTTLQNVNIAGTTTTNTSNRYQLYNPVGAKLTGILPVGLGGQVGIYSGAWSGTGSFNYTSSNAHLIYGTPTSITTSSVEWPLVDGPGAVDIVLTGPSPYNRVFLSGPRTTNTLFLSNGVLALGNNDLNLKTEVYFSGTQTTNAGVMIATNGSGRLFCPVRPGWGAVVFPVGDITGVDESSPVSLTFTGLTPSRVVSVRVVNAKHPADTATTNYMNRYWEINDSGTVAENYLASFTYLPADRVGNVSLKASVWNGVQWMALPASMSNNTISISTQLSTTAYPLTNVAITARDTGTVNSGTPGTTYVWTGAVDKDYNTAGNWNPTRTNPNPGDFLLFNNGQIDTVNNIPTQTVSRITVTGNTSVKVNFQTTAQTLTLWADTSAATEELRIDSGSSFKITTTNGSQMNFAPRNGRTATAKIAGWLEIGGWLSSGTTNPILSFTNCSAVVTPSGILATNGSFQMSPFASSADSLIVYGKYHCYLTSYVAVVPVATWKDGSTVLFDGTYGSNSPNSFAGLNQNFYDLTYDNPNQFYNCLWANMPDSVRNVFRVTSTGTKKLSLYVYSGKGITVWNKYIQTGGNIEIPKGLGGSVMVLDSFYKTAGGFDVTGTAAYGFPTLWFCGKNGRQLVNLDASPAGSLNYRISNPAGIQMTGTGSFSGLKIANDCGLYLSTTATTPIATTLPVQYLGTNSTLTFDTTGYVGSGNLNADSIVFPVTAGPPILTINTGTHDVTMPISRTITGKLKMMNGNIDLGSNELTLGSSATSAGTLDYTDGLINVTTGSFIRWFNPASLPYRSFLSRQGDFPIGYRGINRWVNVYFNSSNALTLGGTIAVRHTGTPGLATGLSIADGTFIINNRSNASWALEGGNGLTFSATGTVGLLLTAGAHNLYTNSGDLHIMQPNAVVGTHIAAASVANNYVAERTGLTLAQLTDTTFHIGSAGGTGSVYVSVASGNWNVGSTWNLGTVPGVGDAVIISAGDTVTVNTPDSAKNLLVTPNGTLRVNAGSLLVDTQVNNNGFVEIRGGAMTLGPTGGGKRLFENKGTLSVSSGTLEVNGSLYISEFGDTSQKGAGFIQSGGAIRVDGNSQTNGAVAAGTYHFYINTDNIDVTGGTLTIVDPHADANSAVFGTLVGSFNPNYTTIFGDGVSTQAGTTSGFYVRASGFKFGKLVVNGSPSGTNRVVRASVLNVGGNMELHNPNASLTCIDLNLGGNLLVDTQTTFVNTRKIYFGDGNYRTSNPSLNSPVAVPVSQFVMGKGVFANSEAAPTANFAGLEINNSSTGSVTIAIGDISYSSYVGFKKGNIYVGNKTITAIASAGAPTTASTTTGWVVGKYRILSSASTVGGLFPIGDSTTYTPVYIANISVMNPGSIEASVVRGDHPAIGSSGLDASKSVNRYFHIDTVGGLVLRDSIRDVTLNWNPNDMDAGIYASRLLVSKYANGNWLPTIPANTTATSQQFYLNYNDLAGDYQIAEPAGPPIIVVQPTSQTFCSGVSASFSASALAASYHRWQVNTGSGWSFVNNNNVYSGAGTATLTLNIPPVSFSGYQYRCVAYNNIDSTISNAATLLLTASVTPAVAVTSNPGTTVCNGTPIQFKAVPVNGGATPTYQWTRNGVTVGADSTYTLPVPAMGDIVSVTLTSALGCVTAPTVQSPTLTLTVNPTVVPAVSIAATNGTTICVGTTAQFSATVTNGGTAPVYQWKKNGLSVGTNSATYSDNGLANGDTINCIVTVNSACPTTPTVTSNTLTMTVLPFVTPTVSISAVSTNLCSNDTARFTATPVNGGAAPQYSWKKNGIATGVTTATYVATGLATGDVITCQLTSNAPCVTAATATSNSITMTVTPVVVPSITIAIASGTPVCAGTPVKFTSAITNGGSAPQYQWRVNGTVQTGATADTFRSSTLLNGVTVTCILTSNAACAIPPADTSNAILMNVTPSVTPTVSVSTNTSPLCVGRTATFTATANTAVRTYQWKVNGVVSGTSSATFSYVPANGDNVVCKIIAVNAPCLTDTTATSTSLTLTVNPIITPVISLTGPAMVSSGSPVTLNAQLTNASSFYQIKWQKNRVLFATTNNSTTSYTKAPGTDTLYAILIPRAGGCYDTVLSDTIFVREAMSVNGVEEDANLIVVMPNPFDDFIHLEGMKGTSKIQLFNGLGQVLQQRSIEPGTSAITLTQLNTLPNGMYYLQLLDKGGTVQKTVKMRKQ